MRSKYRKVPGGKGVKVEVEAEDCRIRKIVISGDFFAYPEDIVEELEMALRGSELGDVAKVIGSFRSRGRLVGIGWDDIFELIASLYPECL